MNRISLSAVCNFQSIISKENAERQLADSLDDLRYSGREHILKSLKIPADCAGNTNEEQRRGNRHDAKSCIRSIFKLCKQPRAEKHGAGSKQADNDKNEKRDIINTLCLAPIVAHTRLGDHDRNGDGQPGS